jgi:hypothetical protein
LTTTPTHLFKKEVCMPSFLSLNIKSNNADKNTWKNDAGPDKDKNPKGK